MVLTRVALGAGALSLALLASACTGDAEPRPAPPTSSASPSASTPAQPRTVTFGMFGSKEEIGAMRGVVESFNASSTTRKVKMVTWPDHESALDDILAGNVPDVFLTSRIDLGQLIDAEVLRPVSLLLDERGVDFGDRFSRDAVDAFAFEDELQCMAYSVSPMVVYYNDELVDFEKMERRELEVPSEKAERWTLEQFEAAARFASRRGDVRGVWIDPSLAGLSPFIHSGGGKVFDDDDEPTSLAFSDDDTREALSQTLAVLRDPTLTPNRKQLARATPLELFKRGRLAMIAGYRNLVPELRRAPGLSFDVISMPALDDNATVGDISGLCISSETQVAGDAADFIAYAVSDAAVEAVAATGYIVPANTEVASSDAFLAPAEQPEHAEVFTNSIRHMVVPPFVADRVALVDAVEPLLRRMVTAPGALDLEQITEAIDEASREVLSPPEEEPTEPSESASE
ncbi:extracellular solute-binding protein [Nocardioides seonyuensis]|uniref:extracellular solute-binding protein n=1 Tax=Nocardioides seonyuensis TaxID=2518371 RepID=UPI00141E3351|nr:extracellular solute-binding protein [Nocardioides seonyuensis]